MAVQFGSRNSAPDQIAVDLCSPSIEYLPDDTIRGLKRERDFMDRVFIFVVLKKANPFAAG